MEYLFDLKIADLQFDFKAETEIVLPPYKGGALRGTFGHTFKNIVCSYEPKKCKECPYNNECAYYYIFETPNNGRLEEFSSSPYAPQPFSVEPPLIEKRYFKPGETFSMNLVLIGRAINYVSYFVYAFEKMGTARGIGKYHRRGLGRYTLERVIDGNHRNHAIYENQRLSPEITTHQLQTEIDITEPSLQIDFLTSTRIKHNKKLVERFNKNNLTFPLLIHSIFRRAYLLYFFHQSEQLPPYEEPEVPSLTVLERDFEWVEFEHYSNRSKQWVPNSGFAGTITFDEGWHPYFGLLKLGEKIHIGKETTFGLGKFIVH